MNAILLPIEKIRPTENRFPNLGDEQFERLLSSIKENGILEPLHVKKDNGNYLLVQGHQRFRAANELKIPEIPCIVVESERAVAAEFDVNLYRRHLTPAEVAEYEILKTRLAPAQKKLIPELAFLEEALPDPLLKVLKDMNEHAQRKFYNSLPQKYVTDPEETKRLEHIIDDKTKRLDLQTKAVSELQKEIERLRAVEESYNVLRRSKKEDLEKALAAARKKIEEEYENRQYDNEDELAAKLAEEKEHLEQEYKEKYNKATEELREIAARHSQEREKLQREINPLKEEIEKLRKDIKMYQTSAENTRTAEKWAQEKLEKIVKMHKIPEMMKTLTKEMAFLRTRMVSSKEYLIELGDAVNEERAAILPTLKDYEREMKSLASVANDIMEMLK